MKTEQRERQEPVPVPQYEEYRTGSWLGTLSQWLGGIGLVMLLLMWVFWPEVLAEGGNWPLWAAGLLLAMFLVPAVQGRRRSRENQAISRRNQNRYDQYCQSLKSEQQK